MGSASVQFQSYTIRPQVHEEWGRRVGMFYEFRPYTVAALGGPKTEKGMPREYGLLEGMSYDGVLRKIVNNPRYAQWVHANKNKIRRSNIEIEGRGVIQFLIDTNQVKSGSRLV